ncbi:glycosyl hydrolase, family 88 [Rhodotorula toruloides]|uniref:Glycosyl hydrolase, family 88 n=1 Tax=Rhodotorula toruloides TaxID=5286 RepID=A0A511KKN7_RHOTO|nr:glycosyl hydrolase, family 88 [Rhodotorula toruloides]
MRLLEFSILLLATLATASPIDLRKRASQPTGLSSGSLLRQGQVDGIEKLLNQSATKSWEIGTHLEAVLEFHYGSLSPFSTSPSSFASPSPSVSPFPTEVVSLVAPVVSSQPSGQLQLIQDGSSADPASVGPFVILANLTLDKGGNVGGKNEQQVAEAAAGQLRALLEETPRSSDGAISHRTGDVELWSDFVYMAPPFIAYYGLVTLNTTLLQTAYDQCRLYRSHLQDSRTKLWHHIENPNTSGMKDPGLWATGNGWAAAGMLRVLATIQNSGNDTLSSDFKSQSQDLAAWVKQIVDAAWGMPQANGLLHNYLNDTSSFADASSTSLMAASTFRLAQVTSRFNSLSASAPSSYSLSSADSAYHTLTSSKHLSSSGVLAPVVDPYSYGEQMSNVKSDGSGNVSPEGEAFVLLMESARRDYLANGGKASSNSDGGSNGAASTLVGGSRATQTVAALVVVASLMTLA